MVQTNDGKQLLQSAWQQAQNLTPKICDDITVNRRFFREEQWYVLQRAGSERLHRINAEAWQIIAMCDGNHTLVQILDAISAHGEDEGHQKKKGEVLTEVDLLEVINQFLHEGLVTTDQQAPANMPNRPSANKGWLSKLRNPLAIRIPLWDPNRFLLKYLQYAKPVFTYAVWYIWLLVVVLGLLLGAMHWSEITDNVVDRVLRPENLLWLWLIYPVTKMLHEFGHAFATRIHGGSVREMGIMFMFGIPLPYVDASAASTFVQKRHRLLVDAIGIMVELFVAALALFIWLNVESGLVSQFAYNTMIVCSISTLFFNGNPLMRFDGYYLLSDLLEMPNLATRSVLYWRYLFKRHLFRLEDAHFVTAKRERWWLAGYGLAAFLYRIALLSGIAFFAAQQYLLLGILLGAWFLVQMVFKPMLKFFHYLLGSNLGDKKKQAVVTVSSLFICFVVLFVFVPLPLQRMMPAVVWMPDKAQIRAGTDGFVELLLVTEGENVMAGQPLFQLSDPYLEVEREIAKARLAEELSYYNAALAEDRVQALQIKEDVNAQRAELEIIEERLGQLTVVSQAEGSFYLPPGTGDMHNRFVEQGDLLAYVVDRRETVVRTIVSQNDIGLILANYQHKNDVTLKVAHWPSDVFEGSIIRKIPNSSKTLPSAVLSSMFGGEVAADPADETGNTALEEWFQFEIKLHNPPVESWLGGRAWVKFELGSEPLAVQLYLTLRQLFMKTLGI